MNPTEHKRRTLTATLAGLEADLAAARVGTDDRPSFTAVANLQRLRHTVAMELVEVEAEIAGPDAPLTPAETALAIVELLDTVDATGLAVVEDAVARRRAGFAGTIVPESTS